MTAYADELAAAARVSSARNGVPLPWVLGVIGAESSFAPEYNRATWEPAAREYAWGPMQILGSTARDRGWRGELEGLLVPAVGVEYGARHLAWLMARYGQHPLDVVSAYNVGRPKRDAGYLERFNAWLREEQVMSGAPGAVLFWAVALVGLWQVSRRRG